jgi:hypothetical protein
MSPLENGHSSIDRIKEWVIKGATFADGEVATKTS